MSTEPTRNAYGNKSAGCKRCGTEPMHSFKVLELLYLTLLKGTSMHSKVCAYASYP
jgi:hypothetical protein